jgi:hypothetical protein
MSEDNTYYEVVNENIWAPSEEGGLPAKFWTPEDLDK